MSTTARTLSVLAAITAALIIIIALAGCGGSPGPSEATCRQAMQTQLDAAIAGHPTATKAAQTPACKGLSEDTLTRLAMEVFTGALNPSPEPS